MAASSLIITLSLLFAAATCAGAVGAPTTTRTALDDVCGALGEFYETPELCASALCYDPSSPCRAARDAPAVAALAARLAAANATAARDRVAAAASSASAAGDDAAGLRACLQLYGGLVPALEWAAGSVAAGRLPGAREVVQAGQYVAVACGGMAGAALPRESDAFGTMAVVVHAVLGSLSMGY